MGEVGAPRRLLAGRRRWSVELGSGDVGSTHGSLSASQQHDCEAAWRLDQPAWNIARVLPTPGGRAAAARAVSGEWRAVRLYGCSTDESTSPAQPTQQPARPAALERRHLQLGAARQRRWRWRACLPAAAAPLLAYWDGAAPSPTTLLCFHLYRLCRQLHRPQVPLHRQRRHPRPHPERQGEEHQDEPHDCGSPRLPALHQEVPGAF